MALFSALPGMIYRRLRRRKGSGKRLGRTPRYRRLALEVLEDRICLSGNLLASAYYSNAILNYDWTQRSLVQTFASNSALSTPIGLALGPNNDVFISGLSSNDIVRYNGDTGAFVGTFVTPGSGGLNGPHDLTFGPDGNLYVSSAFNSSILRYNGITGAPLPSPGNTGATFVSSGSGGLNFPHGLAFGPDGNLYVADRNNNDVLRYNGTTGGPLPSPGNSGAVFVPAGTLSIPTGLVFGPNGDLYVDSFNTNDVLHYNGTTGAYVGVFASGGGLSGPQGLTFGPDGNLYVSSFNTDQILSYNGTTGSFNSVFASGGGLGGPVYLLYRRTGTTTTISASPSSVVFGQAASFTATVGAVVPTSGVPSGTVTFSIDGVAQAPVALSNGLATFSTSTLSVGSHAITATYSGDLTFNTSTSAPLNEPVNKHNTLTTGSASAVPSVFGQPVSFTALVGVVPPGAGQPSGTVSFSVDGVPQASEPINNGQATYTTAALGVGSHTITASYNGDVNDNPSSVNLTQTVNPASTTTMLAASAPSVFGQLVSFTAAVGAVAPGAGVPSGSVIFSIDGTAQAPVPLSGGQATFSISSFGVGSHSVTATYTGDGNFTSSTSAPLSQTVNPADTTTTLSASADPSVFGEPVIFTAVVAAAAPGAGVPTGSVIISVDGVAQATVPLANGRASFTTSTLSVGNHALTASYTGDNDFNPDTSGTFQDVVNQANSTTTISSSVAPSLFGEPVVLTASVAVVAPGEGSPTGSVTFTIDGAAGAPVPLNNGQAAFTTSGLSVGDHVITATYSGDGNFISSSTSALSQVVNKADTLLAVKSLAEPSVFGQPVALVATVSALPPGAGTPSGEVIFTIDGAAQAPVALSNGQAVFTTSGLSLGSHTVTASYNGDASFNPGTSAPVTQVVNQASTTTSISASSNPSVLGQSVTLTAIVNPLPPGGGVPTGEVSFSIDGMTQPLVLLSNGEATLAISGLSVGSHSITASYTGDGNFVSSTSAALSQAVNKADTTIAFSASPNPSVFGQPVKFTALVSAVPPGEGLPTGTVTFCIDGVAQPPVALNNGQATFTTSTLSVGTHEISIVYSGDGNFNSSSLDPVQTVNKADTSLTLGASTASAVFGQLVTFTASAAAVAPGAGTPSGSVVFLVDGIAQAPVSFSNELATLAISTLAVGNHTITASYSGDGNFNPSSSAPLSLTVSQATTSLEFSVSVALSVFGQTVTFTALVAVSAPGAGSPTGTVTFSIDGTAQLPSSVNQDQATFSTSTLQAGSHEIAMTYNGDVNFISSTLDPTFTVVKADTATTLTSSSSSSELGQAVSFTAAVGAVAPGAGTPTGSVTFDIDGAAQTPIPLTNGQAVFTTSTLGAGNHTITAGYGGDGDFNASTSTTLSYTVNQTQVATATAIRSSTAWSVFGHPVTFTAFVSPLATGAQLPTGTVTFAVDGEIETTVNLVNGTASFTTSSLAAGSHVLVATYNGDSNFLGSESGSLTFTVERHGHSKHHHRHGNADPDHDRPSHEKDPDRDDAQFQQAGGRFLAGLVSHSDPLLQRILALKARILSRRRTT